MLAPQLATKEAFAGGWFHSGDLVRDDEGFLYGELPRNASGKVLKHELRSRYGHPVTHG